jgi:hypothetical protein
MHTAEQVKEEGVLQQLLDTPVATDPTDPTDAKQQAKALSAKQRAKKIGEATRAIAVAERRYQRGMQRWEIDLSAVVAVVSIRCICIVAGYPLGL